MGQTLAREGLGRARRAAARRASPTCSTSTSTSCTRSPARRPSTGCGPPGRTVRRPDLTMATEDHNVPTLDILAPIADPVSRTQVDALRRNGAEFGIRLDPMGDRDQGIVHVIGPQLGLTQPGMTIVCGDSHTSTHGAFGALAFGIGTSEVEHVLATQTLPLYPAKQMAVTVDGDAAGRASRAKDVILALIAQIGTGGGQGHVIEYRGSAIEALSMEGRMTICNMSIEAGARAGMIAPDETTFDYLQGPPARPAGRRLGRRGRALGDAAHRRGRRLRPRGAHRRRRRSPRSSPGAPTPARALPLGASVPDPAQIADENERAGGRARAGLHGPDRRHADARDRGRHRLPRLLHQRPDRGPAGRRRAAARQAGRRATPGCSSSPARWRSSSRPRPRAWTGSSSTPAPSGAARAARCAWA